MVSTRSGGAPPSGSTPGSGTPFEQPDIPDPSRNTRQDSEETVVGDQSSNQPPANNGASSSRSRPTPAFTKAQRDELFAMELRIKQAQLAEITARTAVSNLPTVSQLNPLMSGAIDPPANHSIFDQPDSGRITPSPLLLSISAFHPGVPSNTIDKIINNTFSADQLIRCRGLQPSGSTSKDDTLRLENGNLVQGPKSVARKDYGRTPDIWAESFGNYASILVMANPQIQYLHAALHLFDATIKRYSKGFVWQDGVLELALLYHQNVLDNSPTDVTRWREIPSFWVGNYLGLDKLLPSSPHPRSEGRRRSRSPPRGPIDEICRNYNSATCTWGERCYRKHVCESCGGDHTKKHYTKRT